MATYLFLLPPYIGHLHASLGLIQYYVKSQHKVIVCSSIDMEGQIQGLGLTYCEIEMLREPLLTGIRSCIKVLLRRWLDPDYSKQFFNSFQRTKQRLENLIIEFRPEAIFVDSILNYYEMVLGESKAKMIFINTRLSTRRRLGIPPSNSAWIPAQNRISRLISSLLWQQYIVKFHGLLFIQQIILRELAVDRLSSSLFRKPMKRNNQNYGYSLPFNCEEWILQPRLLDYPWSSLSIQEKYVNLISNPINNESINSETIRWLENASKKDKLIFCSLGTIKNRLTIELCVNLLTNIIKAFYEQDEYRLLIAAQNYKDYIQIETPSHVFLSGYLPQREILKRSDIFITHGGINSIHESVLCGVPMLVFPINLNSDQPGNAARVAFHKIGLFGSSYKDSSELINGKVKKIIGDENFKKNIKKMQISLTNVCPNLEIINGVAN